MSRSKRTDPKSIRAARRLAATARPVRIVEQPPRPGHFHPAGAKHVGNFLGQLGPLANYGLKEIILARCPVANRRRVSFGRYEAPGRVILYEQPSGPWNLEGELDREIRAAFAGAGARIEFDHVCAVTIVTWPAAALRAFMLETILLHELGHHILQQHKAKRPAPAARTRDHEAFAELFVQREQRRIARANA
jgi:hypothetical protein